MIEGCRHSSVNSLAPFILPPWIRVPGTPTMLLSIYISIVSCGKDENKQKEAGIGPLLQYWSLESVKFKAWYICLPDQRRRGPGTRWSLSWVWSCIWWCCRRRRRRWSSYWSGKTCKAWTFEWSNWILLRVRSLVKRKDQSLTLEFGLNLLATQSDNTRWLNWAIIFLMTNLELITVNFYCYRFIAP